MWVSGLPARGFTGICEGLKGSGWNEREMAASLLERVPDYKMGYVLAYLQGITADEAADDAFCERMYESYRNDPDPEKDVTYSLEECKKEWGLD